MRDERGEKREARDHAFGVARFLKIQQCNALGGEYPNGIYHLFLFGSEDKDDSIAYLSLRYCPFIAR